MAARTKTPTDVNTPQPAEARGRKPLPPAEMRGPEFVGATPPAMATQETIVNQAVDSYTEERDLVNQLLGQSQMAGAFEEFSRTVRTSKLAFVKENKVYRALKGKKSPHGAEILSGTWEEFCTLLGRSVDQVDRDIDNLRAFGEEAMKQLSSVGAGYRDLRKLRALPDDTRTSLLESPEAKAALETGDRDALRELIEDMATAHAKTKAQVEELQAEAEAHGKIISGKDTKINELDKRLKKAERRVATLEPDEALAGIRQELAAHAIEAEAVLINCLSPAVTALMEHHADHGGNSDEVVSGALGQIERVLQEIRESCGLVAPLAAQWAGE